MKKSITELYDEFKLSENERIAFREVVKYAELESKGLIDDAQKQVNRIIEELADDIK